MKYRFTDNHPIGVLLLFLMFNLMNINNADAAGEDDPMLTKIMLDQFEYDLKSNNTASWDAQAWSGYDLNKFWLKTEGEYIGSNVQEAELQALYSRAILPYWDVQLGFRKDIKPSPSREWAVIGIQGLAPYFFDLDVTFFIDKEGGTAFRLNGEYEILITQRLILTPEIEINLYGKNDPEKGIGSGLADLSTELRLAYRITREFSPYIGINWIKKMGDTADYATEEGEEVRETQFVIGIKAWF